MSERIFKTSEAAKRAGIAGKTLFLVKSAGPEIAWASLKQGRASLKVADVGRPETYYELNHIGLVDKTTNSYPATRYTYAADGMIIGVIHSQLGSRFSMAEVESAMKFQVDNGLFAPNSTDYDQLIGVLDAGLKEAPLLHRLGRFGLRR
jgi:hypothetical protein